MVYLAPSFFAGKLLIETTQCVCICMRARVCVCVAATGRQTEKVKCQLSQAHQTVFSSASVYCDEFIKLQLTNLQQ